MHLEAPIAKAGSLDRLRGVVEIVLRRVAARWLGLHLRRIVAEVEFDESARRFGRYEHPRHVGGDMQVRHRRSDGLAAASRAEDELVAVGGERVHLGERELRVARLVLKLKQIADALHVFPRGKRLRRIDAQIAADRDVVALHAGVSAFFREALRRAERTRSPDSERSGGESVSVDEIRRRPIVRREADANRLPDTFRGKDDFAPFDARSRRHPFANNVANLEFRRGESVARFESVGVLERDAHGRALDSHARRDGSLPWTNELSVDPVEHLVGHARTDSALVGRMYVVDVAYVVDYRVAAVRHAVRNTRLRLLDHGERRALRRIVLVRRELHEKIGEVALPPFAAPSAHKRDRLLEIRVAVRAVGAALVPYCALDRIRHKPRDHPVPQHGRYVLRTSPFADVLHEPEVVRMPGRGPRLDARPAPRAVDEPDRNAELAVQSLAEEERDCALRRYRLRRRRKPVRHDVVKRLRRSYVRRPEVAYVRPFRRGDLLLPVLHLAVRAHGKLHVALPRAKPHLAYDNVRQGDLVRARHAEVLARGIRRERRKFDAPAAVGPCRRGYRLPRERNGDLLARRPFAPDRHALAALKHHVVSEDMRQRRRAER